MGDDTGIIWMIILPVFTLVVDFTAGEQYCFTEIFMPTCNASEVIVMTSALYGRPDLGRCITNSESLGCYNDVISYMDHECSGRQQCRIQVFILEVSASAPCLTEYKNHLEATYSCERVTNDTCGSDKTAIDFPLNTMVQAYDMAGSPDCPWRITVQPGQRIMLDLLDFTLTEVLRDTNYLTLAPDRCPVYIVIREVGQNADGVIQVEDQNADRDRVAGQERVVHLCTVGTRRRTVYTSISNQLSFSFNLNTTFPRVPYYLFTYTVDGCPFLNPPENTEMKTIGNSVEVHCNMTGETWYLVCDTNHWLGSMGNCTEPLTTVPTDAGDNTGFPYVTSPCGTDGGEAGKKAILIAVAIGVGVGIGVGLLLLGIVLGIRKCYSSNKKKKKEKTRGPDLGNIQIPDHKKTDESAAGPSQIQYPPHPLYKHSPPLPPPPPITTVDTITPHSSIDLHLATIGRRMTPDPNNVHPIGHSLSQDHIYDPMMMHQQGYPTAHEQTMHQPGYPTAHEQAMHQHGYPTAHEQAMATMGPSVGQSPSHKKNMYPSLDRVRALRQQQQPQPPLYEQYGDNYNTGQVESLERNIKGNPIEMLTRTSSFGKNRVPYSYDRDENLRY